MQLLVVPLGLLVVFVESTVNPSYRVMAPILLISFSFCIVHYGLARSRYARLGCWIQVLNAFLTISAGPLWSPGYSESIWFLALPILFAQLLLGERAAAALGVLAILQCVAYQTGVLSGVNPSWMQIAFLALLTSVVVLVGFRYQLVERDRSKLLLDTDRQQTHLLGATFHGTVLVKGGTIVEVNDSFANLVGAEAVKLKGRPVGTILQEVGYNYPTGTNVGMGFDRIRVRLEDGGELEAEWLVLDIERNGESHQLMAIRDLTEQILLQSQLQHSRRMAAVGHLAAAVAHEINNPLAVMQLRVDLLREDGTEPADIHFDVFERHMQRIAHIVRNLRSFAKPSQLARTPQLLSKIISDAHRVSLGSVSSYSLNYTERTKDLKVRVVMEQIQQVFVNLFLFAREHVPEEASLEVCVYQDNRWAKIQIGDSMGALDLKPVEGLFKGAGIVNTDLKGSALGFAIAWGIVQEYGGVMFASMGQEHGDQIEFSLHLDEPKEQSASDQAV